MKIGDLILVRQKKFVPFQYRGKYGIIIDISEEPDLAYQVIIQGKPDMPFTFFEDEIIPAPIESDHTDQE